MPESPLPLIGWLGGQEFSDTGGTPPPPPGAALDESVAEAEALEVAELPPLPNEEDSQA